MNPNVVPNCGEAAVLGRATDRGVRLIVFIFKTLKLQKENSPRRSGSFLCDQKEGNIHPFAHPGSPRMPRPMGIWPCVDTDSTPFEDRPLSKLKESDRCSARENLYLDALSLDDEPEEPPARGPQREFRNCLPQVGLGFGVQLPAVRPGGCQETWPPGQQVHIAVSGLSQHETLTMPRALLAGPEPKLLACAAFGFTRPTCLGFGDAGLCPV